MSNTTGSVVPGTATGAGADAGSGVGAGAGFPTITIPAGLKFDGSLGALFIGAVLATLLYGIICVQVVIYTTSNRGRSDSWWLKGLVFVLFALDTAHSALMLAGMYTFVITNYANPFALLAGQGDALATYDEAITGLLVILFIQWFFTWRFWQIGRSTLWIGFRIIIVAVLFTLSCLDYAGYMLVGVFAFQHKLLDGHDPTFQKYYKMANASAIAFDAIVTIGMTLSLHRSRSGIQKSDHVINLLIMFTVNTNLLTTILSVSSLITLLASPSTTIFAAIAWLLPKTYLNSFLAILNSRDSLQQKLHGNGTTDLSSSGRTHSSHVGFSRGHNANPSLGGGADQYELAFKPQLQAPIVQITKQSAYV